MIKILVAFSGGKDSLATLIWATKNYKNYKQQLKLNLV